MREKRNEARGRIAEAKKDAAIDRWLEENSDY
jgi:hypothetical protein